MIHAHRQVINRREKYIMPSYRSCENPIARHEFCSLSWPNQALTSSQLLNYTQVEVVWENFSFELQEGLGVWAALPPKPLRFEYNPYIIYTQVEVVWENFSFELR